MSIKHVGKIALFLAGLLFCLSYLNQLFKPSWYEWNNYDTINGFYKEPHDSIETLFLGTSVVVSGISPMELYDAYGICSYNLGTEGQPMLASYYWLEEAYRLHSGSLRTVVLDVSSLRRSSDLSFYRKAIDGMKLSPVKIRAVQAYVDDPSEVLSYLLPLSSYHTRWGSLTTQDFISSEHAAKDYMRGYYFRSELALEETSNILDRIPTYALDTSAPQTKFDTEALYYLKQIIDFCQEHELQLILIKAPMIADWTSSAHNAVQAIADEYELEYFDFSFDPLLSEIGYNAATDSFDIGHMNYYGAKKLTLWLGQYLVDHCGATDVRGMPHYAYLEQQLQDYHENVSDYISLVALTDPVDYITQLCQNEDYTIFIMAKDEASFALTEEQRAAFRQLGLEQLSELGYQDSYLGIIDAGTVLYDQLQTPTPDVASAGNSGEKVNDLEAITPEDFNVTNEATSSSLYFSGALRDGAIYSIESGGFPDGNVASCVIESQEYAANLRGLNIVVYNNATHQVVDSAVFDTYLSSLRESGDKLLALETALEEGTNYQQLSSELQTLYLYNILCDISRSNPSSGASMLDFIEQFRQNDDIVLVFSSTAADEFSLDESTRAMLAQAGLIDESVLAAS